MIDKQEIKDQLILMTKEFCSKHANEEHSELCKKLINKMARKRTVPFTSGRPEIWAAAIVHALGTINFLFDRKTKPYASHDTISDHFGTSKTTVAQKSKAIRQMFKMNYWDPEFSTKELARRNPYARMNMVNGYLILGEL